MADEKAEKRRILAARYKNKLDLLTPEEASRIHEASLYILEHTGVLMPHPRARELEAKGARVDRNSGLVRFPPDLVEKALREAPQSFTLCARDPGQDLPLNGEYGYLTLDGSGLQVIDLFTGRARKSTRKRSGGGYPGCRLHGADSFSLAGDQRPGLSFRNSTSLRAGYSTGLFVKTCPGHDCREWRYGPGLC